MYLITLGRVNNLCEDYDLPAKPYLAYLRNVCLFTLADDNIYPKGKSSCMQYLYVQAKLIGEV